MNTSPLATLVAKDQIESVFDLLIAGGPLMIPIALCSIVALSYAVERSIRLRDGELGSKGYGKRIVETLSTNGPREALEICDRESRPLGRILAAGLRREKAPVLEREKAVENLVKPIRDALEASQKQIAELEKSRSEAYGSIRSQLEEMHSSQKSLKQETQNLVNALRRPEVRGRWGEITSSKAPSSPSLRSSKSICPSNGLCCPVRNVSGPIWASTIMRTVPRSPRSR